MRVLGVDFGQRRLGLAVSDDTASLARPWQVIPAGGTPGASAQAVARFIGEARGEEADVAAGIGAIVVGVPRRLGGEDTDQSQPAREFATALGALTGLEVHLQDERLSSREAESRLAINEKDWRKRKLKLDAAAAAVILQDYLDRV